MDVVSVSPFKGTNMVVIVQGSRALAFDRLFGRCCEEMQPRHCKIIFISMYALPVPDVVFRLLFSF